MNELNLDPGISSAMADLGISQSSLDADEITDVASEGMDAAAETNESLEGEATELEAASLDDAEIVETEAQGEEKTEAPTEEPVKAAEETEKNDIQLEYVDKFKALEEERNKFQAAMTEQTEKFQEKLRVHDEFDAFFIDLEAKDPDLYSLVKSSFHEHTRQYNNPVVSKLREEQESLRAELDSFKSQASAEVTLTKLDGDVKKLEMGLGKEAEAAGIKMDLQKVKDAWAKNPNLSLEEAAFVVYGPSIMKATASKAKVQAVEKKIASRPAVKTSGSVKSSASNPGEKVPSNTFDAVQYFARQFSRQ